MIADDVSVTAMEMVASGDHSRVGMEDLRGTAQRLRSDRSIVDLSEALFVTEREDLMSSLDGLPTGVTDDGLDSGWALDPATETNILAEAAWAVRRQRLADASDRLTPLTDAEAALVGRLDLPGNPSLGELRAERRRLQITPDSTAGGGRSDGHRLLERIDEVISDLRAAVRYGAAGLADAADSAVAKSIHRAAESDGWIGRLRVLIVAEEIRALAILDEIARALSADHDTAREGRDLLAAYERDAEQSALLITLLEEALGRAPAVPEGVIGRVAKRGLHRETNLLRDAVSAYRLTGPATESGPIAAGFAFAEAVEAVALFDAGVDESRDQTTDEPIDEESMDDFAKLLGDIFAAKAEEAQTLVDQLRRDHPGMDAEGLIRVLKRRATRDLAEALGDDSVGDSPIDVVAVLTLGIALLRGVAPRTAEEYEEYGAIGLRIVWWTNRVTQGHGKVRGTVPTALNRQWVRYAQRVAFEAMFSALGGAKPGRPGAARDAYKALRSLIWGLRYDRNVTDAASEGAAAAVGKGVDALAPWLIVRFVDRAVRKR